MKRRTPILAVVAAVVLSTLGLAPAQAELDDPVVSGLDSSVAGHVTGTISSLAPFARVHLPSGGPAQVVTMTAGTGTFDLLTWGYSGTLAVSVSSCEDLEATDCSDELASTETFTPTDLVPDVTWPTDTTVGPDDEPTVTAADPGGGGDLRAVWDSSGPDVATAVTAGEADPEAAPLNLTDGSGTVTLLRCRAGSTSVCTGFSPAQSVDLTVRTTLAASVGTIDDLTAENPSSDVAVDTDANGTYDLTWTLTKNGSPTVVQNGGGEGTLDGAGGIEPFTVSGADLLDGDYTVEVTITVVDDDFGTLPVAVVTGAVTVDGSGPTLSASVGAVALIKQSNLSPVVTLDTNRTGTYTLDWHLEQNGTPVAGTGGTPSGTLDENGATTFTITGSTLADGVYDIVTSITVTEDGVGTYPPAEATGTVTVDRTGPVVTLARSVATIYPLIATTAYPALTRIDVTGSPSAITGFEVRTTNGVVVRHLTLNVNKTVWNGRNDLGKVVYAATYNIYAVDADGNSNATAATVTVSRKTLVLKKFVTTLTASGSMFDKFVGKCSQLRIPSSRGTAGSLGFYANNKCTTQTFAASAVSTAHAVKVPEAAKYVDVRVDVTGGGAKVKPTSKGIIRYLNTQGAWTNETTISSPYGVHTGPTRSTTGLIDPNRFFVWGFVTAYGSRYDVIRYTVVVRYYVLG